jgi:SAM-dependent methyltransferase
MTDPSHYPISQVRAVFDDWALRGRAEGMEHGHGPVARRAFEQLDLQPNGRYLDIGCGNGYTVRWAAATAPEGRAIGIDIAPEMIRRAKELSADFPNAEFFLETFPEHHLPRASFDAVFSMEVLYYLPSLSAALEEIVQLLKPGGRFASVVDFYQENEASHSWPDDVGVAMRLLSAAEWRAVFEAAGLTAVEQSRVTVPEEEASESGRRQSAPC